MGQLITPGVVGVCLQRYTDVTILNRYRQTKQSILSSAANLQVGDIDLVLSAADEGGELLAAEHPQPVQPDHVTHAGSENESSGYER